MGGRRPERTETVSRQELSPEQRQLITPVIPTIQQFAENPPEPFPGATTAGPTSAELLSRLLALQTAGNIQPTVQGGVDAQQQLQGAGATGAAGLEQILANLRNATPTLEQFTSGALLDPASNPALQSAISAATRPITDDFLQSVLPRLRSQAISSGQFGGTRQGIAEGLAAQGAQRQIGDISAGLANQAFQSGLDATTATLGQLIGAGADASRTGLQSGVQSLLALPQTLQASLFPASILEQVGLAGRADEQARIDDEVRIFEQEQLLPFLAAQEVARTALGLPGGPTTTTSVRDPGSPGFLRGALGGLIGGFGLGGLNPLALAGGALLGGLGGR